MKTQYASVSNSMIERLLKDLNQYIPAGYRATPEIESASNQADAIREKLLADKRLKQAEDKVKELVAKRDKLRDGMIKELRDLRAMFLSQGASPALLAKAKALVVKFSRVS